MLQVRLELHGKSIGFLGDMSPSMYRVSEKLIHSIYDMICFEQGFSA